VPWSVELLDEVDSTNRQLLERARRGAPAGLVLVADHQTAGRGRLGRVWEAPPGSSLLVSVLLRPNVSLHDAHLSTTAAALAITDACALVAGVEPALKWPNDLTLGEPARKVAGLLAESIVVGDRVRALVIGVGLNVNWPKPMPPALAEIATALNQHTAVQVDRDALLRAWLDRLTVRLESPREALLADYRAKCATLGRRVRLVLADREITGLAVDVDEGGQLVVDGPPRQTFAVGDIHHLRD
jgi:BirA family biotin operon repressor/biotin-[acetyl-CoA-carboxylase] ligase